jgi:hypothetical protein
LLRVHQIGDRLDHPRHAVAGLVLGNPVETGQARVEHAGRHVARHLLSANQHALDLGIVDRGEVRARVDVDVEARTREELDRRILQRSLGESELQLHGIVIPSGRTKKQVRSPV